MVDWKMVWSIVVAGLIFLIICAVILTISGGKKK